MPRNAHPKQNKKPTDGEYMLDKIKLAERDSAYPKDWPDNKAPIAKPLSDFLYFSDTKMIDGP